ncbi:MAG: helix-turn-helix transcriptional regulator [Symploca sp. SIO1B1]|nr:helix-turn-helix transcriptional regulator [Symploca sp. SIO2G7]NEQ64515.1 helix-turn-helix transcriptional regulator [Symploca sp. SIO2D2]NER98443.1 helix-turn-helix transcriptional regulator [Symploca sp. SIO1B1]
MDNNTNELIDQVLKRMKESNPYKRQARIIRLLREIEGLDQRQLGQLLGVDHSTISRYERVGCNDFKVLCRLSEVFGSSLDVFKV